MTATLPKRLRNEPILDVLFECRFTARLPVVNILPGIIFSEFNEEKQLERLPHADIPEAIRKIDPNLQYAPLVRIRLQNYSVLVGDQSVSVACNLPYRGWDDFKKIIIKLIGILKKSKLINSVSRYSVRYVDIIQSNNPTEQVKLVNLSLKIGSYALSKESYQVRMDIPIDDGINIIKIISGAEATMPDKKILKGVLIDIDTIKNAGGVQVDRLELKLDNALDEIHLVSKKAFFDCLTEKALMLLEPEYE